MIAVLIALGVLGNAPAQTGEVVVPAEQTVLLTKASPTASVGSDLPLGAYAWDKALDPSDWRPYAYDFSGEIDDAAKIGTIDRLTMSEAGAAVGVQIDQTDPRRPIIDTGGKRIKLWFRVDPDQQANPAFLGNGIKVGVAALISTDETPFEQIERTGVLTVRQR